MAVDMEAAYQRYLAATENYNAAIREAGDLPWWADPSRRAAVCRRIGIPEDTEPAEVRRALFQRHRRPR